MMVSVPISDVLKNPEMAKWRNIKINQEKQRKTRKIEYLRYRLEKLYYPLLNHLKETSKLNIIDIEPFVYLGSNKLIKLFNIYLNAEFDPNIIILEFQDAISNLMKVVDEDINKFKYELDELIG